MTTSLEMLVTRLVELAILTQEEADAILDLDYYAAMERKEMDEPR